VIATGSPAARATTGCAEFAAVVETILQRRRSSPVPRRAAAPGFLAIPRAWTHDELCLEAYSSYRALLRGAVRRPPRREVVLAVADYLQCSHAERNQLLTAAGYAAEQPAPGVAELRAALDTLSTFIETLPLPAYAVSRDWTVQLINDHLLRLLGLARAELIGLPAPKRNVLRLLFDPALPVRRLLEPDAASWSTLAAFTVMRFREDNEPWQYDHWYRGLVTQLSDLPDFGPYWQRAQSGRLTPSARLAGSAVVTVARADGRTVRVTPMNAYLHGTAYPGMVTFLPADAAAGRDFRILGLPSPVNRWGATNAADPAD
jgi:hypothetical protein